MTVYTCANDWESMLTCIYVAWASKKGHNNIKLMLEPIDQYNLFDEYIHVEADGVKASKVIDAVKLKISPYVYQELAMTALAYEEDALDNIYRVMILGFAYGKGVLDMLQFKDVMRNHEIRKRVEREANRFQEIIRFHQVGAIYVAHIEPKSRVLSYLGPVFQDRMPSEYFMIVDDVHSEAIVHPKDEAYYLWKLSEDELTRLLETEEENDDYTDLWQVFFDTISIEERKNEKCQANHFPKWARKHAVEFIR